MPELALNHDKRFTLVGELDGAGVPQLMVVPTSARTSLSRPAC
jgi:hypothetical protein